MKQLKFVALFGLATILTFYACSKEDIASEDTSLNPELNTIINNNGNSGRTMITNKEYLNSILSLNLDVGVVTKGEFILPDGTAEERIFLGDDITISSEELDILINAHNSQERQYRTFNLVTGSNRTIDILGYTANNANGLTSKAQTALQWAVNNYNNLNTTLQFNLTFG